MKLSRRFWLDFLASLKAILFPTSRLKRLVGTRRPHPSAPKRWRPRLGSTRSLAFQPLEPKQLLTTITVAETANANAITGIHGTLTVTASPAPTQMTTVNYSVSGTAVASQEYNSLMSSVMLSSGQTTATIDIAPISNGAAGTSPTVIVTLTSAMGATIGSPSSATDTITEPALPTITGVSPSSGPTAGGTSVTISGSGFTAASGVSFGGTAATNYTVNSSTSITAVDPAESARTVNVTVTGPGGTSATGSQDQFTYSLATPVVSGVSPAAGPLGGGTTVTITGSGFTAASGVSFGVVAATNYTVNSSTSLSAVDPTHSAGLVDVTVTNAGGTSATSSADQFSYQAAPTVSGTSPNLGGTAGGTSVTITGTNFSGASVVDFGTVAASSFTVNSSTSITAVDPSESAGTIDVTVVSPGGTSATGAPDHFIYQAPPSVSGVSPNSGPTAGGTTVVISGANMT
ncbi:MAG TPA: IPT/TIG domain-containing protein, partial [Pirellulales bacterium]|nr:IPT/TIG domain-containing protein [Pirellulales bacterium]